MARPYKKGLDFWPKDTAFYSDSKVRKIIRREGAAGAAILDGIFCTIYREGWYLTLDDDIIEDIAEMLYVSAEKVKKVIEIAVEVGFFHEGFYRKNSTLTSLSLQSRYVSATSRRQKLSLDTQYILLDGINADNNPINADNNHANKRNKINKIYSSSFYSSIVYKEKEEFFLIFYLKNVKDYRSEYQKFVAHYASRDWRTADGTEINDFFALANAWVPKDSQKVFGDNGLALMAQISAQLRSDGVGIDERKALLGICGITFDESGIRIQCTSQAMDMMESHIDNLYPIIRQYGCNVNYTLID